MSTSRSTHNNDLTCINLDPTVSRLGRKSIPQPILNIPNIRQLTIKTRLRPQSIIHRRDDKAELQEFVEQGSAVIRSIRAEPAPTMNKQHNRVQVKLLPIFFRSREVDVDWDGNLADDFVNTSL
jgi:hypothetical protein